MKLLAPEDDLCHSAAISTPPVATPFYRKSGVFDTEGNLVTSGAMDAGAVKRLQSSLPEQGIFIVVDLVDTWIRPFSNERQRREMMDQIVQRAPFLITKHCVFFVAKRVISRSKCKVADIEVTVLDQQSAKARILASNRPTQS